MRRVQHPKMSEKLILTENLVVDSMQQRVIFSYSLCLQKCALLSSSCYKYCLEAKKMKNGMVPLAMDVPLAIALFTLHSRDEDEKRD